MYITFYNSDGAQILINTKYIISICRNDKVIEITCQPLLYHTEAEAKDKMQGFINSLEDLIMFIKITDMHLVRIDGVSYVPKDNKLRLLTDKTYEYSFANHLEAENAFNELCKILKPYDHTIIPI